MNVYKKLRKEKELTQNELAKLLNVKQGTVSKWELNKAIPDYQTLIKFAEIFNVSIDYLFGKSEPQQEAKLKSNKIIIITRAGTKEEYDIPDADIELLRAFVEKLKK